MDGFFRWRFYRPYTGIVWYMDGKNDAGKNPAIYRKNPVKLKILKTQRVQYELGPAGFIRVNVLGIQ